MSYLLFFLVCKFIMWFCVKNGLEFPNDEVLIMIAILTAGEVISWRCKK